MSKPPAFLFDTNGTNSDADLSPALKADGYANGQVPTARQFDTALRLISGVCRYVLAGDLLALTNIHVGAPAWQASHLYAVGDRVNHDTGKLYECLAPGTSAASGGPVGTGATIADGSTSWTYVSSTNGTASIDGAATIGGALEVVGVATLDSTLNVTGQIHSDADLQVNGDARYGAVRLRSIPFRAGYGTNAAPGGPSGFNASGASWVWGSEGFGESGEMASSIKVYYSAVTGTVTFDIYVLHQDGSTSLEHSYSATTSIAGNYAQSWTPTNTLAAGDTWWIRASGTAAAVSVVGAQLGIRRP